MNRIVFSRILGLLIVVAVLGTAARATAQAIGVYVGTPYRVYSPVYGPAPGIYAGYAAYPNPRRAYRQAVRYGAVVAVPAVAVAYPAPVYVRRPVVVVPAPVPAAVRAVQPTPAAVQTMKPAPAPTPAPAPASADAAPELVPTPQSEANY